MSLTNRILLAMVLGIALGSILNVVVAELDEQWTLRISAEWIGHGSV